MPAENDPKAVEGEPPYEGGAERTSPSRFELAVGFFVLAVLAGLPLAFYATSGPAPLLSSRQPLELETWLPRGFGLGVGSAVTIKDVRAGEIIYLDLETASPQRSRPLLVRMRIEPYFADWLGDSTVAGIDQPLLGGPSLELISRGKPPLKKGLIGVELPINMMDRIDSLEADLVKVTQKLLTDLEIAETVLTNLSVVTGALAGREEAEGPLIDSLRDLQALLTDFRSITDSVKQGEGVLGRVLQDQELAALFASSAEDLRSVLADARETSQNLRASSAEFPRLTSHGGELLSELRQVTGDAESLVVAVNGVVRGDLPGIVADLKRSLADLKVLMGNLKTASGQLPEMTRKVDRGLDDGTRILESVQRNFLVRMNLPEIPPLRTETEAIPRGDER